MQQMTMPLIECQNLHFHYSSNKNFELDIPQFHVSKNEHIFIEGASGSGKTTFLNLLTGLLHPQKGAINILGKNIAKLNQIECDRFRADHFGIIFQLFNLIPYLSVIENILLPCSFSQIKKYNVLDTHNNLEDAAYRLCDELNIDNFLIKKPVQNLSIGQQQRVAIARALIGNPEIIIADEPTSALDQTNRTQFVELLLNECKKHNITLLFVSHEMRLKSHFSTVFNLLDQSSSSNKAIHVTD